MKSLLTWTERRLLRLFRKLSNRQNFHLKAEMFSFHSKYFVYRELKKAPQKLSFCFKWPDTGTVRILGNICISLILLLHIKLINHMTCISCPSQLLKYLLSLQIFSTSDICQFRWLSLQTENVLNYTNFQSWWWDWCLQLQTNFIIVKLQQYFWKNYVQRAKGFIDKHITDNLHPNTVLPSTFVWTCHTWYGWIYPYQYGQKTKNFFPVEGSLILRKSLILWTIKYLLLFIQSISPILIG